MAVDFRGHPMFPVVFDAPYLYANPVSGRTALPPLPSIRAQLRKFPLPEAAPRAPAATSGPARE